MSDDILLTGKVSLAVLVALAAQIVGGAWWASKITAELEHLKQTVTFSMKDRYTSSDASRDFQLYNLRLQNLSEKMDIHLKHHEKKHK